MSIEAMKQAVDDLVEALQSAGFSTVKCCDRIEIVIADLRQAIEEAEKQEPVACDCNQGQVCHICDPIIPPKREWVGLTKEEIDRIFWIDGKVGQFWWERTDPDAYKITQMIEAALKAKNT